MVEAGYSGTPLPRKLGLKDGQDVGFVRLPADLANLAEETAFGTVQRAGRADELRGPLDLIHAFEDHAETFRSDLPALKAAIRPAGAIWISWPKKAAKVATDLSENVIRDTALAEGLVDIKVCAVSEVWSGLKLVIPVAARGGKV